MNRVRSLITLNALITHAYCIGCVGLSVPGTGITEGHGYHVQAWTLSRSEPFVCTHVNINKATTDEASSTAVSGSSAIESTSDEKHTSQETVTGAKGAQSTLQTTTQNNVRPTNGVTSQMTSDPPFEKTTTGEFVETTLQTSVRGTSEEEKHPTSEISVQGMTSSQLSVQTTVKNQASSTSPMTSDLSTKQTEKTTNHYFDETPIITPNAVLETTTERQTSFTSFITTDPTTHQIDEITTAEVRQTTTITTTVALETSTDRQTSSTPHITTNTTTEPKTTTTLETTTDRQTSSTPQVTTDPTTQQKTTTVGLTTLKAANRACNHSKPPYCYELIYEKKTYADAYYSCRRLGTGSNLVSMVDSNEANDVKLLIVELSSEPMENYWIGLGRISYSWEDGKPLLYHNFASGYVSGICTVLHKVDHKWKYRACTSYEKTICESDRGSQSCTVEFEGSCYNLLASTNTQPMAKTTCEASGGYVLQIETKAEQLFIQGQFSIGEDIWIGLRSDGGDGFRWTDGASYEYNDFGSYYGDNFGVCFRIDYNDGFHWNDDKCHALHNSVCKWNL